jgi:hypothetical protein
MALRLNVELLEKPYFTKFWGQRCKVRPKFCRTALGDGKKLIFVTPLNTRPDHYLIRVDSSWDDSNYSDRDCIGNHIEEIYDALEEWFGYYFDGESSEYEQTDGEYPGWPVTHLDSGSCWGTVDIEPYKFRRRAKREIIEEVRGKS